MKKDKRIAIRVDKPMFAFLEAQAKVLDNSVGHYIRQVLKEKMNDTTTKTEKEN